jgi:hypothetical protein
MGRSQKHLIKRSQKQQREKKKRKSTKEGSKEK